MASTGKGLQVGQTVRLVERACGFHIIVLPPGESGPEVVEVGLEHAVFEDIAAGVRTRLPLYLVDSVAPAAWPHTATTSNGMPPQIST